MIFTQRQFYACIHLKNYWFYKILITSVPSCHLQHFKLESDNLILVKFHMALVARMEGARIL